MIKNTNKSKYIQLRLDDRTIIRTKNDDFWLRFWTNRYPTASVITKDSNMAESYHEYVVTIDSINVKHTVTASCLNDAIKKCYNIYRLREPNISKYKSKKII